jgi:hypothetical protein
MKITTESDPKLYEQINETVKKIVRNSPEFQFEIKKVEKSKIPTREPEKKGNSTSIKAEPTLKEFGHCIHCDAKMELNPIKPLCLKCYTIRAKSPDKTYQDNYCHVCGKESKQSFEKPVCYSCYKKLYK